ncbi:MAG: transposase [Deltaproteobacteria bacterium]|nr:transposase [Deltaproteobacteria bacterium]
MGTSKLNIPIKGSSKLRTGRRSVPGQVYLLTSATFKRRPIFQNKEAAEIVLNSLFHIKDQGRILLEAAVVMPDHVHVVAGLVSETLGEVMQGFKGFTAWSINRLLNRKGPVWNSQYHDHAVRKDEVLLEVIRYCLNNPVRAGLVKDFHDYPHWYCRYKI